MTFVDTNYFLRFLLKDVGSQHEIAKQLFKDGAENKAELCTSLIVFFEIFWVLSSFYEKRKDEVVEVLKKVLAMEFIQLDERYHLQEALEIFTTHATELEDAYNLVYARKCQVKEFKTFDKKLSSLFHSE